MTVRRFVAASVAEMMASFRAVVVGGARQVGKSTLVRDQLGVAGQFSLDDPAILARIVADPVEFVAHLPVPSAVDEYQRGGVQLLLAVKHRLDHSSVRGQLVLTGSASYQAARAPVETLAGRVGRVVMWPLSQGEIGGTPETFLDRVFGHPGEFSGRSEPRAQVMERVLRGGYPEVVTQDLGERARRRWFGAYAEDVVSREALRPLADVRLERELRHLMRNVAARTSGELVLSDLARDLELAPETTGTYLGLLEALYLVHQLPAWSTSATTRAKRRPKLHVVDTGLAAGLGHVGPADVAPTADGKLAGSLLETFVVNELAKQNSWSDVQRDLWHFRDRNGDEVDIVITEPHSGRIVGIEVKATSSPSHSAAKSLERLRDRLGDKFAGGVVLHTGRHVLPFSSRVWAVPVADVWA